MIDFIGIFMTKSKQNLMDLILKKSLTCTKFETPGFHYSGESAVIFYSAMNIPGNASYRIIIN